MDNAPPVDYPIGATSFPLLLVALVWGLALAGVVALAISVPAQAAMSWIVAVVAVLALLALRATRQTRPGFLVWDGKSWTHVHDGRAASGRLIPALDFQRLLLLRFRSDAGATAWCWAVLAAPASRWEAFRRAVVGGADPS